MRIFIFFVIVFVTFSSIVKSDDRKFTYTYETNMLAKNQADLEIWSTYRGGKESFYSRFDNRMEFEIGLTQRFQTAFYLNFSNITDDDGMGGYKSEFEFEGVSTEFKYQLLNKYKNGIGFAPYLEFTFNTNEIEIENKLIFDKQFSKFTTALNIVGEYEWKFLPEKTRKEFILEFDLGIAYSFSDNFSAGIEARSRSLFPDGEGIESSAIFLGPSISYASEEWFAVIAYLPQLPAIKRSKEMPSQRLVLDEYEKNNVRLILGFSL